LQKHAMELCERGKKNFIQAVRRVW